MEDLLNRIALVDEYQIDAILNAVLARYAVLYPDWEICTLSLPRSSDRNHNIDEIISLLELLKNQSS